MTSKLKCPVCGKTELIRMFNPLTGEYFEDYDCPFRLCNFRGNKVAVDALIQAKQDLEIAKSYVKGISEMVINSGDNIYIVIGHFKKLAEQTLKQIEHKGQQ